MYPREMCYNSATMKAIHQLKLRKKRKIRMMSINKFKKKRKFAW